MQALILEQQDGNTVASVQALDESRLPEGDVTVDIDWSSLNYKDALAITGKGKIIRNFPMVPGIDFAGHVHSSEDPRFHAGQQVLLTGWGVGENHWGGLATQARVKGEWLVPMPAGLDGRKAMIIGTAGFTAMLCVMALEDAGIRPESGEIVVTGASGGVGSTAVALLHKLGYQVVAVSGRESTHDYLRQLGASRILGRDEFAETRPLEKQIWAGAVDTVGNNVLAKVLAQMNYGGCVAACGLAGGFALPTTVMPFILRNVRLQGVDSVMTPAARRAEAWERLVRDLPESFFTQSATEIALSQAPEYAGKIMDNQFHGRALVKIA
ncbi:MULTISPECIES: MDR family oxidoreductase [Enterobacter cloacae complex]|jgi:acrylyl-CoA reductase (NADPH)|uniref:Quinone oxidoreductase n=1 Tax=Enterobacter cloacae subsp. cloacae TaxID=336306 RepID=A0AAE2EDW0_ENTCL|nr:MULTISPECIES: MDR family oxidoreductase [Enterobacter cloacae complex]EKS9203845.1 oxidoreductase [Enterobacter cloacae]EKV5785459.1 oxidoreductase [Enterobacter cloacae]KJM38854.1 quinone oxidoreductase [Enterobacter cloacae subsp. cloacae]KTI70196.1 quinone oxidoreductase [Enterobacter cloacae subsp. cloacae]KVI51049.1 quinone oxidoreductase [Enterobacter cloacae subsp. cloacae]